MSAHVAEAICDHCGGDHYSPICSKPQDEAAVVRNRSACIDRNGGQGGRVGGCPIGGPSRGNGGGNSRGYQRGKFGPPKPNEIVCKIEGKVYCACKECGWNHGDDAHTTGAHTAYLANSYVCPPALKDHYCFWYHQFHTFCVAIANAAG